MIYLLDPGLMREVQHFGYERDALAALLECDARARLLRASRTNGVVPEFYARDLGRWYPVGEGPPPPLKIAGVFTALRAGTITYAHELPRDPKIALHPRVREVMDRATFRETVRRMKAVAASIGDDEMVRTCHGALNGLEEACRIVAGVILLSEAKDPVPS